MIDKYEFLKKAYEKCEEQSIVTMEVRESNTKIDILLKKVRTYDEELSRELDSEIAWGCVTNGRHAFIEGFDFAKELLK